MNKVFGKDFYRKGNSAKRFGPVTEPPDSENQKVAVLIPFPKIGSCFFEGILKQYLEVDDCPKSQSLKNHQYSTEGEKLHQNLALVIISWISM